MKQIIVINKNIKLTKRTIAQLCAKAGLMSVKVGSFFQKWKWFINKNPVTVYRVEEWEGLLNYLAIMGIKYHLSFNKKGEEVMVTFFHKGNLYLDNLELY